jgi:hypothetical protein
MDVSKLSYVVAWQKIHVILIKVVEISADDFAHSLFQFSVIQTLSTELWTEINVYSYVNN